MTHEPTNTKQDAAAVEATPSPTQVTSNTAAITIIEHGPYVVTGDVPLYEDVLVEASDGAHLQYNRLKEYEVGATYHLCRCGASQHMPFCDGAHVHAYSCGDFDGTETASREPYEERTHVFDGAELELHDDKRCAFARLCHRRDGSVWEMMRDTNADKQELIAASWQCPTGRLEHHDKQTGQVYEQTFEPSIVLLEDPKKHASGPVFVRGGIPLVSADGSVYENRNRYALCRCGASSDKPFCDARHWHIGFQDGSDAFDDAVGVRDESFKDRPEL